MRTAEAALRTLNPKIKKSLHYTHLQNQEDLEQELKMKITECYHNEVFEQVPGFWEFLSEFN